MVMSFPLWPDKIVHLSSCSLSIYLSRASPHYCRESAWNRVSREAYLANKDIRHGNVLSVVRFTLHEIRATKNGAADRRLQQKCS